MITLDFATIDAHVDQPGIALVEFRHPRNAASLILDAALAEVSRERADVRFGSVDMSRERELVRDWEVGDAPTLMVYRDGVLLFRRAGSLPAPIIEDLLGVVSSLDMDEVRRGMNGEGTRIMLAYQDGQHPLFELLPENGGSGGGGATGRKRR
jgi:thioredoxin 1